VAEEGFKRKLTAVLSADVVGYSRLMEEEDMATVRNLRQCQSVIANLISRYRGRVVDSPGDNLLAEFKSVVEAVQCAVEIQRELAERNPGNAGNRKMEYRVGVNLGEVIQEGGKIYGDGINVAARLEAMATPGGICISGIVYDQVKKKIDLKYHFLGKKRVKNIEDPVEVYQVILFDKPDSGGVIKANVGKMAFPLPERPSIAVLPFTNMSGDPAQEYIGDGISENIINALSMGSAIFVIARNSTFTYKGRAVKVQHVAEDLGVRYVLEGSVQKAGERLRVTAQLIDALTGRHLWSEKYDRKMGELFDLQDEVTKKIVVSLQVELTSGEQARVFAKSTDNLDAWCYGVKGNDLLDKFNRVDNIKARELLETAIELDPRHVSAIVWLGATYTVEAAYGWSESPVDSFNRAHELAQRALKLDDKSANVHILLGTIYLAQRLHDKAIAAGNRSISLAPNLSIAHAHLAATMFFSGRFEEAIALTERAMRMSPYYPAFYLSPLARSYAFLGRYEEAIATSRQLYERGRTGDYPEEWALIHLAGLYVAVGREDEASDLVAEALKINSGVSLTFFKQFQPFKYTAHMQRELSALKKAGLRE
jgi:adenylate cyclase